LVVTSSPGGSYSNWWCSLFNADLALSVTMTAISTILSILALPANLLLYANFSYHADVTSELDWVSVFVALAIVISAIAVGLYCSYACHSHRFNIIANQGKERCSKYAAMIPRRAKTRSDVSVSLSYSWKCSRLFAHHL
jgi:hypothetical protein